MARTYAEASMDLTELCSCGYGTGYEATLCAGQPARLAQQLSLKYGKGERCW